MPKSSTVKVKRRRKGLSLSTKLKKAHRKPKRKEPLWKGPEVDGITQSMLSRFVVCRERFRLRYIEGLKPVDQFNHRIEYGNMWHLCEESHANNDTWKFTQELLKVHARNLCQEYQVAQEQVQHWYNVAKTQFPIYVNYWTKHKERKQITPLLQEEVFNVSYKLSSGRVVKLRGKWDGVNLIGKGRNEGIYLQENKTKGDIKEDQIKRQLQFDLQTMFYLVVLQERLDTETRKTSLLGEDYGRAQGVTYNVVRRPLSGGKGSIRQHKPTKTKPQGESTEEFYARLSGIISEEPEYYFMRWRVEITPADMERFRREFLDPILEQLYDWWYWVTNIANPFEQVSPYNRLHYRTPYGIYNILAEGGASEVDEYLATGSELGLERTDKLFTELE